MLRGCALDSLLSVHRCQLSSSLLLLMPSDICSLQQLVSGTSAASAAEHLASLHPESNYHNQGLALPVYILLPLLLPGLAVSAI